jgi:PAS domain-containing protein/putative methionine-R-sulfoxide reductase with GAF domain
MNVTDVNLDVRYNPILETKTGSRVRSMICAPVICDGKAVGVISATNKGHYSSSRSRSPHDSIVQSFSPNEAQLLAFVAANVGLTLKHTSFVQSIGLSSPTDVGRLETDFGFQKLVDLLHIYNKIDAERVSVFLFSPVNKNLVCVVSQDIKGLALPHDRGLAGLSFTAMRTINVADARYDERHFKDVDQSVGFTTRSVLCSPIITSDGVPLGVVQAINKKSGPSFTSVDEQQILAICDTMVALLKDRAAPGELKSISAKEIFEEGLVEGSKLVSSEFSKGLAQLSMCSSITQLVASTEHLVLTHTDFDFFRAFVVHKDRLVRIAPLERLTLMQLDAESTESGTESLDVQESISLSGLSLPLQQALQFSSTIEYHPVDNVAIPLLPLNPLTHAIVIPVETAAYPFTPGNGLLICGHNKPTSSEQSRLSVELICEIFSSSLAVLSERLKSDESARQLRRQYHLLNSTLGTLHDFVIILDSEGKLLGCNKPVEDLLGLKQLSADVIGLSEKGGARSRSFSGRSSPTPALDPRTGRISEGKHYSEWLTNGNSPELCRDIQNALLRGESRSLESARLTSNKYPEGISVDYQITAIGNPQHYNRPSLIVTGGSERSNKSGSPLGSGNGSGMIHKKTAETLPDIPENENTVTTPNQVVVVTIHINKRSGLDVDDAVPSAGSAGDSLPSMDLIKSASIGVDSAASILAAVRNNYVLDAESELQIKTLTSSLVQASRRMSIKQSSFSANPINIALQSATVMLVDPSILLPEDISEWTFNVLKIKDSLVLCNIIGRFFESLFNLERLCVDPATLARFIAEAGRHYHDRPFHNLQHATCVSHFCYMLIRTTGALGNLPEHLVFSILLSAVVHDVDHPGNTNLFEINSGSELAIRYNDQSVLENHHCSTAFRLMRKPHMQVLSAMEKKMSVEIRKSVIACIMATDMAVHFELIEETKKRANNGWNFEEVKDQALLGKILLHAADLSNPVRPFHMTREWARRISIEFNDQVQREQALGMPVLGFMMTPDEKAFCKNEMGFASFVVAPMWRTLTLCYPELEFLVKQLDDNLVVWKAQLEKIQNEEAGQEQALQS